MKNEKNSYRTGHRARLREKFLAGKLTEYEVVELLLTYAIPRIDVKPLVHDLMKVFGGVHGVLTAPIEKLQTVSGLKQNTAVFIKAIYEIMLLDYKNYLTKAPVFQDYKTLENYCLLEMSGKTEEEFHVLYLDTQYRLLSDDLHSKGTIDRASVYPREIVRRALDIRAKIVVLMHNHPSGLTSFSEDDIKITEDVKQVLKIMEIELFDHLLVSGGIIYSAKNMMLFK